MILATFGFIPLVFLLVQAENSELNLRDDEIGVLKGYYFPYSFKSGAGNREDLILEGLLKDSNVSLSIGDIDKWTSLTIGTTQYLIGSKNATLYLITIKIDYLSRPNLNTFYFKVTQQVFQNEIKALTILEHYDQPTSRKVPLILIAFRINDGQIVKWYKVNESNLEEIFLWEYPSYGEISQIKWLKEDNNELLVIISHDSLERTLVDIFNYNFNPSRNIFNILCLHKMPLEAFADPIEVTFENGVIHVMTVIGQSDRIFIYRGGSEGGDLSGMTLIQQIICRRVTQIKAFRTANRGYLIFNGDTPGIYKLKRDGVFKPQPCSSGEGGGEFPKSVDTWMVLKVNTYKEDVIILGKSGNNVTLFTWTGTDTGFVSKVAPPCRSVNTQNFSVEQEISPDLWCLVKEDWSRIGQIEIGDTPSLIVVSRNSPSSDGHQPTSSVDLYHFQIQIKPTYGPSDRLDTLHQITLFNKKDVECLSEEFSKEGMLANLERETVKIQIEFPEVFGNNRDGSSSSRDPWSNVMDSLETCLNRLGSETEQLSHYLVKVRDNSVNMSLSMVRGKLVGKAIGKVLSEDVKANLNGYLKHGTPRSRENKGDFDFDLKGTILLNNTREYKIKTAVKIGVLEIEKSPTVDITPVHADSFSPELSHSLQFNKEEIPLHQSASREIYGRHKIL